MPKPSCGGRPRRFGGEHARSAEQQIWRVAPSPRGTQSSPWPKDGREHVNRHGDSPFPASSCHFDRRRAFSSLRGKHCCCCLFLPRRPRPLPSHVITWAAFARVSKAKNGTRRTRQAQVSPAEGKLYHIASVIAPPFPSSTLSPSSVTQSMAQSTTHLGIYKLHIEAYAQRNGGSL